MMLILGIIIGFVISVFILLSLVYLKTPIERQLNQVQSKLKTKGSIIEPEDSELEDWLSSLPKEHENQTTE